MKSKKYFTTFKARQNYREKLGNWASDHNLYLICTEINSFGYILEWRFTKQSPAND